MISNQFLMFFFIADHNISFSSRASSEDPCLLMLIDPECPIPVFLFLCQWVVFRPRTVPASRVPHPLGAAVDVGKRM